MVIVPDWPADVPVIVHTGGLVFVHVAFGIGGAVTVNVAGILSVFISDGPLMMMCPVNEPTPRAAGDTPTLTTAGVVHVLAEVAVSHVASVVIVIGSHPGALSPTVVLCDAGIAAPVCQAKVNDVGFENSVYFGGGGVTGTTAVTMFE